MNISAQDEQLGETKLVYVHISLDKFQNSVFRVHTIVFRELCVHIEMTENGRMCMREMRDDWPASFLCAVYLLSGFTEFFK